MEHSRYRAGCDFPLPIIGFQPLKITFPLLKSIFQPLITPSRPDICNFSPRCKTFRYVVTEFEDSDKSR